ncbi:hypothetical protein E4T49_02248 [Aureobasidium sp. EXF-10728]|nr:hypothetical protein E4T49_02248 [Aureobasidium sp. EXF-10728]
MTLVSYSDSEDDDEPVAKRIKNEADQQDDLPPLPASFLNLYSSSVRVSNTDDPSLHHGRKRVVKHVEGNWPTHVYLELRPASLSWHANDDSSRYFLVLRVQDAQQTQDASALTLLNQLLQASNKAAHQYNQPQLYTKLKRQAGTRDFSPYFHISIGWSLPSPDRNMEDDNLKLQPAVDSILKELCENMTVSFDAVKIRIGQTVTALPIGSTQPHSRKRGGVFS